MKRLILNPEPRWVKVDDELSLAVRPLSPFDLAEIGEALGLSSGGDGDAVAKLAATAPADLLKLIGRLTELAVAEWTVCDEAGQGMPVSAEAARALVRAEPDIIGPYVDAIIQPTIAAADGLAAEKNASGLSPNGSTAGAATTAPGAARPARPVPLS